MPVGSSIIPWTRRLKDSRPQWHNSQDSTGTFYRKMGRDLSCWEAVGKARETFILIAAEIKVYLEKHSDPVPYPVTWTIYMIGRTKETSQPMIMFCCRDSHSRKQVRKTVEGSGILDQYQKVGVGDASRPPDFDQLVQLAGESFESASFGVSDPNLNLEGIWGLDESFYATNFAFAKEAGVFFGKPIALPFYDKEGSLASVRMATAGGVLRSGGRCFYLTAGHVFKPVADFSVPHQAEDDNSFEFDIGERSDSEDDSDFIETTSRGSITPDLAESDISEAMTASVGDYIESTSRPECTLAKENLKEDCEDVSVSMDKSSDSENTKMLLHGDLQVIIGHLLNPPEELEHPSLDYALIEIYPYFRGFKLMPLESHLGSPRLHPRGVAARPRDSKVLSVTGSAGLLHGTMSGTPTYMTIPGSRRIQELWTVRFEGKLVNGDCGSWVVNAQSGDLLGHIVAGSPESGVGYIAPAYQILEDAKTRFGLDLELYPTTESTAIKDLPLFKTIATSTPDISMGLESNVQVGEPAGCPLSASTRPPSCEPSLSMGLAESSQMISKEVVSRRINANDEFLERRKRARLNFQIEVKNKLASFTTPKITFEPLVENLYWPALLPAFSAKEPESEDGGLLMQQAAITTIDPLKGVANAENGELIFLNNAKSQKSQPIVPNLVNGSAVNGSTLQGANGRGFYMAYLESLCRRRCWLDPRYATVRSPSGFTCVVLVNGRVYRTDISYESDGLAQENAAMRAFMVCRNFSVNGGMLARNGVVQGLTANKSSGMHRRRGGYSSSVASASTYNSSTSSSTTTSE
ncbi:uncharacterized protein BP5553_07043 [Venustampulla echinocandica]|uniref:DRBM domain-containing protein n=1 Tax=Venustampulla echinocandica TaxID=2656787 RepID=A0A370TIC4_9HELO|nr:uncharacterized protein BP5553_07043 [Venustampulla echinocandica]RDL35112.1 hypothetical protein BP5553_07043 [Venustampulla echinocandica]